MTDMVHRLEYHKIFRNKSIICIDKNMLRNVRICNNLKIKSLFVYFNHIVVESDQRLCGGFFKSIISIDAILNVSIL